MGFMQTVERMVRKAPPLPDMESLAPAKPDDVSWESVMASLDIQLSPILLYNREVLGWLPRVATCSATPAGVKEIVQEDPLLRTLWLKRLLGVAMRRAGTQGRVFLPLPEYLITQGLVEQLLCHADTPRLTVILLGEDRLDYTQLGLLARLREAKCQIGIDMFGEGQHADVAYLKAIARVFPPDVVLVGDKLSCDVAQHTDAQRMLTDLLRDIERDDMALPVLVLTFPAWMPTHEVNVVTCVHTRQLGTLAPSDQSAVWKDFFCA